MKPLLLDVRGVSKSFPGVQALADMHVDLRGGEVLALVGENGAGKSTLMKLLSGIYTVDEGEFFLNGEPYEPTSPKHALELGISIIHQEFNLMPDLTVAQNLFIGREPGGFFTSERRLNAQARELIERLHLPLRPKELVGNLTVAKQQMVEIGKALSYDAKLLIMDEPTAALNDAEVSVLHGLIRRFVRDDTGVIYISHRLDEVRRIGDRVTVIRDGRYVGTRETKQTNIKDVISMMVGRELSVDAKPVDVRADRDVVLEVSGLCTKDLLEDVSFELRRGEILGFAGLMGAGRTEVARAVVGADRADAGTIRLRGREIRINNPAEAAKHRIGYLSEDRKQFGLLLEQEVNANIGLSALAERFQAWGFVKDKAMRATSREYVGTLRIKTPSVAQTAKFLSGGNQQKVVIAKWLVKDCDSDVPVTTAATDNKAAAAEAAKHLSELIGGKGKVAVIVHDQTSRSGIDRRDGFVDWMKQNAPDIKLLPVQYGGGDQAKSADIAKSIISANPDLKGFYGANEGSAIGVIKGVEESGKKGITIVGFDSGKAQIDAIKSGVMAGAITQNPVGMGKELVKSAMKAINGETLPKVIDTGFYWYDKTNIDDPKIQAVLYQ